MLTPEGLSVFRNKRVLLLQGPVGPFFNRLSHDLRAEGAQVFKVNFNGGDQFFFPFGSTINYRGRPSEWPDFFSDLLDRLQVDWILLFGDCRSHHQTAQALAKPRGIGIGVYEEGYVRPDYVTLERHGVNGHSTLPRNPDFYHALPEQAVETTRPIGNAYWHAALWATLYYVASTLLHPLFPFYKHHRPLTLLECLPWVRSAWRRVFYAMKERGVLGRLTDTFSGRFFLVPLQVHNDTQLCVHSHYTNIHTFIEDVVDSFALHAPEDTVLVLKHHPMDRGYHDYTRLIRRLARKHRLAGRLRYIHDQHLPTLLQHTAGVVLINSTVGLSALHHGTPVKVTGVALYDMPGLTFQGSLEKFWSDADLFSPDKPLFRKFRGYLINRTQINGSFYKPLPQTPTRTGLVWTMPADNNGASGTVHPLPALSPIPTATLGHQPVPHMKRRASL